MERLSDNYYVEKIRDGEIACFAPLLERYSKQVFSLVVRIVGNKEDAEELAQDVFVKAYSSLSSFRGECSFSTWIYRIAYNIAISATRKKSKDFVPVDENFVTSIVDEDDEMTFENSDFDSMRFVYLSHAMDKLMPDERAMITLFYKEGKLISEIAVITGLTETNVKTKIFRIRKKLFVLIKTMEKNSYGTD